MTEENGAFKAIPDTFNLQNPLYFRFFIKRLPEVNYYVNKINIPALSLPAAMEASPQLEIPQPGDHVQFQPLVLDFLASEGLKNYIQLQKWLKAIGGILPKDYAKLASNPEYTGYGVKSEIILSILDGLNNAIVNVTFHDAWPTSLSQLQFDATLPDIPYLKAQAVFRYTTYEFEDSP
jgi:hypothetical protein